MRKIKKILPILSLCLILGAVVCGCGQKGNAGGSGANQPANEALVGTWTQVTDDGTPSLPDVGIPSGYVFRENGEGEDLFWNMEFTYTATTDTIHISYKDSIGEDTDYKYSIENDTLTMTRKGDSDAIPMLYQKKEADGKKE